MANAKQLTGTLSGLLLLVAPILAGCAPVHYTIVPLAAVPVLMPPRTRAAAAAAHAFKTKINKSRVHPSSKMPVTSPLYAMNSTGPREFAIGLETAYYSLIPSKSNDHIRIHRSFTIDLFAAKVKPPSENCIVFPAEFGVNAKLGVTVNGAETFVDVGATLGAILKANWIDGILKALRLERLFQRRLLPISFDRDTSDIRSLVLMPGDQITW